MERLRRHDGREVDIRCWRRVGCAGEGQDVEVLRQGARRTGVSGQCHGRRGGAAGRKTTNCHRQPDGPTSPTKASSQGRTLLKLCPSVPPAIGRQRKIESGTDFRAVAECVAEFTARRRSSSQGGALRLTDAKGDGDVRAQLAPPAQSPGNTRQDEGVRIYRPATAADVASTCPRTPSASTLK